MSSRLIDRINVLHAEGLITDGIAITLRSEFMDDILSLKMDLLSMVTDWESKLGEDDNSLYSLGLRRAIDKVDDLTSDREVL